MSTDLVSLLVVDDHVLTRTGLKLLVDSTDRYRVAAMLENGSRIEEALAEHSIDVIVLDLVMPGESGLSVLARIIEDKSVPIIILTGQTTPADLLLAREMGASAIVSKADSTDCILTALDDVMAGKSYFSPSIATAIETKTDRGIQLTPRQLAILRYMAKGETNKEIGYRLGISAPTVSFHMSELRQRRGVSTNRRIVPHAQELGII